MESYNSAEIKNKYFNYSIKNGYQYFKSDPITASETSKLLFNISGGIKYQEELLGIKKPTYLKIASIQKCLRTDTLDKIGISGKHHIEFEMLGHFNFYNGKEIEIKKEFIEFAYKFLIEELKLSRDRIFVTAHPKDYITKMVWERLGVSNIIFKIENIFVSPYCEKSALRTEILWQKEDKQLMELYNLVFTQFDSKEVFKKPLELISADSGASLERITTAFENKNNNYENSMWLSFIEYINSINSRKDIIISRKIGDLFNASVSLIEEGITPGNKVQNYVLRKLMRISFELCEERGININDILLYLTNNDNIINTYSTEQIRYNKSIEEGLKSAKRIIKNNKENSIDYDYLKSTCGLPRRYVDSLLNSEL